MRLRSHCLLLGWMGWLLLGAAAQAPAAAAPAVVTYSRSFPGSVPAYVQIEVAESGAARFAGRSHDGDPLDTLSFQAAPSTVREIFRDASSLGDFSGPALQSTAHVAYTGDKTLNYHDGSRTLSQHYTYTRVPAAAALTALFDRIAVTGMDAIQLQRAMRFQPLDALDCMDQIQSDWSDHMMGEPQLLEPTLRQAIADDGVMDAAKHRAQHLLDTFAKAAPAPAR